jgi:excisionase family DNA binding protein
MSGSLLTPEETAVKLRVSSKTVRDWLREHKIEGLKIGRQWRVKEEVVEEILQKGLNIDSELDPESKNWLNSMNNEELPEYNWSGKKPKMKKVTYIPGEGFTVENDFVQ